VVIHSRDLVMAYRTSDIVFMILQLSFDWRKILEVLILGQFVVDKVLVIFLLNPWK
jgi:hypothetical protein